MTPRSMSQPAALACVKQLLAESLRSALPEMQLVVATTANPVGRANGKLLIDTALVVLRALEQEVSMLGNTGDHREDASLVA